MAEWALVRDNKVEELRDTLPLNWEHVSGLRHSSNNLPYLNSIGWYKVVKRHDKYDSKTNYIVNYTYNFTGSEVEENINLGIIEQPSEEQKINEIMEQIREKRNNLLLQTDWTQLQDVKKNLGTKAEHWKKYRQMLRDLPQQYQLKPVLSFNDVIWPEPPGV